MAYVRVVYSKKDCSYDYVSGELLSTLIVQEEISHFFRPSENRWVSVKLDSIKGSGGAYCGPERRNSRKGAEDSEALRTPESLKWYIACGPILKNDLGESSLSSSPP